MHEEHFHGVHGLIKSNNIRETVAGESSSILQSLHDEAAFRGLQID